MTALPDVLQVDLTPADRFIVLACDGIWDCMTNQQAVPQAGVARAISASISS